MKARASSSLSEFGSSMFANVTNMAPEFKRYEAGPLAQHPRLKAGAARPLRASGGHRNGPPTVTVRRLAAPARKKADREEGNDDDDDPQDSAEDAPPFDDTRSFRPSILLRSGL